VQQHILFEIARLIEQIKQLEEEEPLWQNYNPMNWKWKKTLSRINIYKKEQNLWEDALLELEQKEIDRKQVHQQQKDIENFF